MGESFPPTWNSSRTSDTMPLQKCMRWKLVSGHLWPISLWVRGPLDQGVSTGRCGWQGGRGGVFLRHCIPALLAGLRPVTFRPREWQEQHLPFLSFISAIFSASNTLQYPPVPLTTSSPPNSFPQSMAASGSWEPTTQLENRFPTPILDTSSLKASFVFCFF